MKKTIVILSTLLLSSTSAFAEKYCGEMYSGTAAMPSQTWLEVKDGIAIGHYTWNDSEFGIQHGTLKQKANSPNELIWIDKFGRGTLNLAFTNDHDSFTGRFNFEWVDLRYVSETSKQYLNADGTLSSVNIPLWAKDLPWSGTRCEFNIKG